MRMQTIHTSLHVRSLVLPALRVLALDSHAVYTSRVRVIARDNDDENRNWEEGNAYAVALATLQKRRPKLLIVDETAVFGGDGAYSSISCSHCSIVCAFLDFA
jgi:hypothetical protein